jgi:hypothetical protein
MFGHPLEDALVGASMAVCQHATVFLSMTSDL